MAKNNSEQKLCNNCGVFEYSDIESENDSDSIDDILDASNKDQYIEILENKINKLTLLNTKLIVKLLLLQKSKVLII